LLPGSIAEVEYLRLGGVDQWVMLRGTQITNPPLVVLHGGPGMSEAGFFRRFNAPLERGFVVVNWDQRGTGKSFDPALPVAAMTTEQFVSDLDELVDIVSARTSQQKVVILGHSWGSAFGAIYASRHPDKVAVYVGAAQIGDWAVAEAASYAFALAEAQRLDDQHTLRQLRAIGPPPYPSNGVFTERRCIQHLVGDMSLRTLVASGRALLGRPEHSILDLPNIVRGFRFSMDAMWPEVSRVNLLRMAPGFDMPVFFFLGRRDHWVPPETSIAYYDALRAPSKTLIWFENSGHEMFVDEPAKFNAAMLEMVRPVVERPQAQHRQAAAEPHRLEAGAA
jgi:pimeloyl-ACP methyl ester carboxylesterase